MASWHLDRQHMAQPGILEIPSVIQPESKSLTNGIILTAPFKTFLTMTKWLQKGKLKQDDVITNWAFITELDSRPQRWNSRILRMNQRPTYFEPWMDTTIAVQGVPLLWWLKNPWTITQESARAWSPLVEGLYQWWHVHSSYKTTVQNRDSQSWQKD